MPDLPTTPTAAKAQKPPFRKIDWLARDIAVERRPDGVIVLKSGFALQAYAPHLPALLAKWAAQRPHRTWLAQRSGPDRQWRELAYGEAKQTVDALTQSLLNLGLAPGRTLVILSGNSIEHALMTQAAMQARLPVAPISPAYSLMSQDHAKLKYLFGLVKPAVVLVQDGPTFARALAALDLSGVIVVHVARPAEGVPSLAFADLAATPVTAEVAASISCTLPILSRAALIYRLSGDYNPIHADPALARKAGFDRPILHGLCSLGVATRAIIASCCNDEPERLQSLQLRFSSPVYPGETLVTDIWHDGAAVSFRSRVAERGVVVLNNGRAAIAPA